MVEAIASLPAAVLLLVPHSRFEGSALSFRERLTLFGLVLNGLGWGGSNGSSGLDTLLEFVSDGLGGGDRNGVDRTYSLGEISHLSTETDFFEVVQSSISRDQVGGEERIICEELFPFGVNVFGGDELVCVRLADADSRVEGPRTVEDDLEETDHEFVVCNSQDGSLVAADVVEIRRDGALAESVATAQRGAGLPDDLGDTGREFEHDATAIFKDGNDCISNASYGRVLLRASSDGEEAGFQKSSEVPNGDDVDFGLIRIVEGAGNFIGDVFHCAGNGSAFLLLFCGVVVRVRDRARVLGEIPTDHGLQDGLSRGAVRAVDAGLLAVEESEGLLTSD